MPEYVLLSRSTSPREHENEESESLLSGGQLLQKSTVYNSHNRTTFVWLTILMVVIAISTAAVLQIYISTTFRLEPIGSPVDVTAAFRMLQPSPNLEKGRKTAFQMNLRGPEVVFPGIMVRVNAAEPDRRYQYGSSVVLGPSDSMIYHWRIGHRSWPKCYINAWVPSPDELVQGNKSYAAEGDVTAIEIWKLSNPDPESLRMMSWNIRPERLSLMGTVNFTSRYVQNSVHELDGQQLKWPTPLFSCSGMLNITIEIVCTSCRLQFEQIFSFPALGFELVELA
ncbi:hypothetical protein PILCRDRAFT_92452 [Piloderma croceum F 1598]|uniref:Ubiquitin 3 binding protein But2 C-terminal domain-containing protein n=1 Tax=Piloderma croceum (strain F 1598) TaxID=765440 RepID=A0A0C3F4E1_PILCF|nr:hypothetical protein PILCRDRAFT_92452 [Piloderma croceum F 1598]